MQQKLGETINASENANIIIDGHYASAVTPTEHVAQVFVLRRNPRGAQEFHGEVWVHGQQALGEFAGGNH